MTASGRRAAAVLFAGLLYALAGGAMPAPTWAAPVEPPATLPPDAGAAKDAARVREAQGLLADLDLWDAPPDGIADAAFRRALQGFQRRVGRDPTGELDASTLRTLRTRAEAARTNRRLDAARAEETAAALAAIGGDPLLSTVLLPRDGDARAEAGRDLAPCRAAPTAACLLAEARETAKGIVDPELRDWALADIAAALAPIHGIESVWPVLRLVADPRAAFTGLRRVAAAQAEAGQAEAAVATARLTEVLPREGLRTWAAVAEALARRGLHAAPAERAADELLAATDDPGEARAALVALARAAHARGATALTAERLDRAEALEPGSDQAVVVAAAWAAVGRPERAEAMLAALTAEADRTAVLVELAAAHARAGDGEAALAAARAVAEPRYRAVALADIGALLRRPEVVREAEAVAAEVDLSYAGAFAWSRIAEAWRALQRIEAAAGAAARIGDDALRVEVLQRLARSPAVDAGRAAGLDADAEARRTAMLDRVARVRLAAQRATALAEEGDPAAGAAVRAAVDDALAVRNPWNRARVLVAAARAVAAAAALGVAVPPPPAVGDR